MRLCFMDNYKDFLKLLSGIVVFFFTSVLVAYLFRYGLNIRITDYGNMGLALADFLVSLIVTLIFIGLYFDQIKSGLIQLKNEYRKNISQILLAILIGYLVLNAMQVLASYIMAFLFAITGVESASANNQELIEELLKSAPMIMIISSCIFAPIEEELLFRGGIRKIIKNKKVFIACSGLIFGLMHVTGSIIFLGELLLLGVVIDTILTKCKSNKVLLSVIALVIILSLFGVIYYISYGNLLSVIMRLNAKEVIDSIGYVMMGLTLSSLYIYNQENILINIGIHAANNIVAILFALFLN